MGDKFEFYYTRDGILKLSSKFEPLQPDHDVKRILGKLYKTCQVFANVTKAEQLPNLYIAIPCKDCLIYNVINSYFNSTFTFKNITYGTLFINGQWNKFINNLPEFYYIGPGNKKCSQLKLIDRFIIDECLINDWDIKKEIITNALDKWIENKQGLFLFSTGLK
mgnify:CR=1 FL=1